MLRREDDRLLTGHGCYVDDLFPEGAAHAVVVRSAMAHARILSVAVDDAKALPGVLTVLTGDDLASEGIGPMRSRMPMIGHDGKPTGRLHCRRNNIRRARSSRVGRYRL